MHKDELSLKLELQDLIGILDFMYDGFLLSSLDGRVFYANQAVERISRIPLDKIVGKTPNELEADGLILEQSILVGIQEPITMVQKLNTGKEIFITSTPIYDQKGRIICFVANYRDMHCLDSLMKKHKGSLNIPLKTRVKSDGNDINWVGDSPITIQIKEKVSKVAKTEAIVLLLGESGVGKEVVANHIHYLSHRKNKPYIQINCGAIPKDLIEAELFGYEKGAFTGAQSSKKGLLEAANGGTVLLDEIGEMPLPLQVKLLRTLQTQTITRLGGTQKKKLNIRFIAATNKDLKQEVMNGTFREHLYYRLNVVPIKIPPLRDRKEDIVPLTMFFLEKFNKKYRQQKVFSPETLQVFQDFNWPGNVRQLQNIIERLVIMSEKDIVSPYELPLDFKVTREKSAVEIKPLKEVQKEAETRVIQLALKKYGTIRQAAKHLKVDHSTIVRKIKKYNIKI